MSDNSVHETLQQAIVLHQDGRWQEAERLYRVILNAKPGEAQAHHNLGILAMQTGRLGVALDHLRQAVVCAYDQGKFWHSYIAALIQSELYVEARHMLKQGQIQVGLQGEAIDILSRQLLAPSDDEIQQIQACYNQGQYAVTETLARKLLALYPEHGPTWKWLGLSQMKLGRQIEAAIALQQATYWLPADAEMHIHLAALQHGLGRLEEACATYSRAVVLQPENAEAHTNLAVLLHNFGRTAEAESSLRTAIQLAPRSLQPLINLGLNLQTQGKFEEAESCFRKALVLEPNRAKLHHYLGIALKIQGRRQEAEVCCRQALVLDPNDAEVFGTLGALCFEHGDYADAEHYFAQAVVLKPDYAEGYNNLGTVQQTLRNYPIAESNYRKAIASNPNYADAYTNLGINLQSQGRISEAEACWRTSLTLSPSNIANQSGLVFHLSYTAKLPKTAYLEEAKKYGSLVAGIATPFDQWLCEREPQRLRVGLVSGDFRNHPVGHFLHSLLREIASTRIDLIAYATQPGTDHFSRVIRPYFSDWKLISGQSDAYAAQMIRADGIHILIDIAGHSSHNRLPIFAWKPAPIQISWLGYLGSTGVEAIDYVLSDPHTLHLEDQRYFTETIRHISDSCICFTPSTQDVEVSPLPALQNGGVTFGSFNNLAKMGDEVVALWSRVLHAVPHSRLVLKASQLNESSIRNRTLQRFARYGVSAERLLLCQTLPDAIEHLRSYHKIDIALDTFPYPGVTTSVEALWMGVPVLTLRGDGILGRAGESINMNAGLPDWIAADETDFVNKATVFAGNLIELSFLRQNLRHRLASSMLFDSARFAEHFDQALWAIWRQHH